MRILLLCVCVWMSTSTNHHQHITHQQTRTIHKRHQRRMISGGTRAPQKPFRMAATFNDRSFTFFPRNLWKTFEWLSG